MAKAKANTFGNAGPDAVYTCVSEPDEGSEVVIRYSTDPNALDSLPTCCDPPPELVSQSRIAFQYFDPEVDTEVVMDLARSCRGATGPDPFGGVLVDGETLQPYPRQFDGTDFAINWLFGVNPNDFDIGGGK